MKTYKSDTAQAFPYVDVEEVVHECTRVVARAGPKGCCLTLKKSILDTACCPGLVMAGMY